MRISDWSSDVCSSDLTVGSLVMASTARLPSIGRGTFGPGVGDPGGVALSAPEQYRIIGREARSDAGAGDHRLAGRLVHAAAGAPRYRGAGTEGERAGGPGSVRGRSCRVCYR